MIITSPPSIGHVRITLDSDEALHVMHSKLIIAYQGPPQNREDRFMDLGGIFRRKKWIRSRLQGSCTLILGLPAGFFVETIEVPEESHLLFDDRHVAFYSDGMTLKSKILKLKTAWITRDLVRKKFSGPGTVGVITAGGLTSIALDEDRPLFVDYTSLIAYPEDASIQLSVYGNSLSSQYMNVQWEIRGKGPVLIQTGSSDKQLEDRLKEDNWLKRLLRELLPFGSVYIK